MAANQEAPALGQLTCVGVGMLLGAHLTPRARHDIESAHVVYGNLSDGVVERWVAGLNPNFISLQAHYREGHSRLLTYQAMVEQMLGSVRAGQRVCGAFYGHPGVFAWVPHEVVRRARAEGFAARMEPGISAAACLYADLGIDPGEFGCQHYEASQFMLFRRCIDTAAYLVLWQVAVAGDRSLRRFATGRVYRELLLEVLQRDYPTSHRAILYRAATLPRQAPRCEWLHLADLPASHIELADTLVLPPLHSMPPDPEMRRRLDALDAVADKT